MPSHQPSQAYGTTCRDRYRITLTMLYTGDRDDIPTFLFYGTTRSLMLRVCRLMVQWCRGIIDRLVLCSGQHPRPRNGFARDYYSVEVYGLQTRYMSVKDVGIIFQRALLHECPCRVVQHPYARFINM